jgi:hypothetical protein
MLVLRLHACTGTEQWIAYVRAPMLITQPDRCEGQDKERTTPKPETKEEKRTVPAANSEGGILLEEQGRQ